MRVNRTRPLTVPAAGGFTLMPTLEQCCWRRGRRAPTSEKVSVVAVVTAGASKVGCTRVRLDSVTVGVPAVWVQV
jgi:hypothetical protein